MTPKIIFIIFSFSIFFGNLKITSFFNPAFLGWVIYFGASLLALAFNDSIQITNGIYISMLFCGFVFLFMSHSLKLVHKSSLPPLKQLSIVNLFIFFFVFLLPVILNSFNSNQISINSFAEKNSLVRSFALSAFIASISSFQFPILFFSSAKFRLLILFYYIIQFLFNIFSFGFHSSKAVLLSVLTLISFLIYVKQIWKSNINISVSSYSVLYLNSKSKSTYNYLKSFFLSQKIKASSILILTIFFVALLANFVLLKQFESNVLSLISNRIAYNFDTLIYLSELIKQNVFTDQDQSGFYSIFSVYLKPFLGLLGLGNEIYKYRSVPQFILSLRQGSEYIFSSFGNSNLIAESIVSSNYLIGIFLAPIYYFLYFYLIKLFLERSNGDIILSILPLAMYFQSYNFFASGQEVVMSLSLPFVLYLFRILFLSLPKKIKGLKANSSLKLHP